MNPGPAPRPPTDRPRLNAFPSTQNVPGNFSQLSLSSNSSSMRSNTTLANGYEPGTPGISRTTTLSDGYGSGGVSVIKEGAAKVKDGMLWKQRFLVLRAFSLDFMKSQEGKVDRSIQLKDVTSVSRSESVPLSFEMSRVANPTPTTGTAGGTPARDLPQKTLVCQFRTDDEIYEWIDAIYSRCPGMGGVSNPTNFSHRVHVGFDPVNGSFVGLPPEWERLLTSSAITKEDYKKHPQAVIEVLEFYSDIHKAPPAQGEDFSSGTTSSTMSQKPSMQYGGSNGGVSVAPPRPQPPNGYHQRPSFDNPSRSQAGTPTSGQRNISGGGPLDQNSKKMNMDMDMRRAMEEEARKVKAVKEQRERERERAREEEERNRKEQEAYNASIPKTRTPMAKQEIGGYGSGSEAGSSSARYNPTRNAPPAPNTDRSRPPQSGSLRTQPAQRQAPQAPGGANGATQQPSRPPYTQRSPSSHEQSPTQGSLKTPQREQQRQPSPSSKPPVNGADRNQSPQATRANGPSNGQAQPANRPPGPNQNVAPLNVGTKQPTGAPTTNGAPVDPVKQAEMALTAKPPGGRQKEQRMSSMTESQVMEKLKQVVSKDNPEHSYHKQKKIGQGASGSVYVARINENAVSPVARRLYKTYGAKANVAIKQMDLRNQPRKELIVNEIIVMKESSHPNIVNFLDSFLQQENNELWVIMEFMEGGALTDVIDNNASITEAQISTICNEVSQFRCTRKSC